MDNETVETSDPEELEISHVPKRKYWGAHFLGPGESELRQKRVKIAASSTSLHSPRYVSASPTSTHLTFPSSPDSDRSLFPDRDFQALSQSDNTVLASESVNEGSDGTTYTPDSSPGDDEASKKGSPVSRSTTPLMFPPSPLSTADAPISNSEPRDELLYLPDETLDSASPLPGSRLISPCRTASRQESPDPLGLFDETPGRRSSSELSELFTVPSDQEGSPPALAPYPLSPMATDDGENLTSNHEFIDLKSPASQRAGLPNGITATSDLIYNEEFPDPTSDDQANLDIPSDLFSLPASPFHSSPHPEASVPSTSPRLTPPRNTDAHPSHSSARPGISSTPSPIPPRTPPLLDIDSQHSPLTPVQSSPSRHSSSFDAPVANSLGHESDGSHMPPDTLSEDALHSFASEGRYSLRARQAKQLRPYAYDKIAYKQQMRSNPDAIVKIVSPEKRQHHPNNHHEQESQEDWILPDVQLSGDETSQHRRKRHTAEAQSVESTMTNYPDILRDPSDLDEAPEEARESKRLVREAKKIYREKKAKERQERAERKRLLLANRAVPPSTPENEETRLSGSQRLSSRRVDLGEGTSRAGSIRHSLSAEPREESPFPSFFNQQDHDFALEQPDLFLDEPDVYGRRNTPESPIVVDDSPSDVDEIRPKARLSPRSRKYARDIHRVMPRVMANKMMESRPPPRRHVSPDARSSSPDEGPLLPGQTRRRKSGVAGVRREIRGDSESSEESASAESDGSSASSHAVLSQAEEYKSLSIPSYRRNRLETPKYSGEPDESDSSSPDGIDDEDIQAYVADDSERPVATTARPRIREGTLIDWMLSRTREIGVARSEPKRAPKRRRPRVDITTAGARKHGPLRQSRLSFHEPEWSDGNEPRHQLRQSNYRPASTTGSSSRRSDATGLHTSRRIPDQMASTSHEVSFDDVKSHSRKRAKKRRRQAVGQTYTFSAAGARISSGKQNGIFTVHAEEEEAFHRALAPRWEHRPQLPHPNRPVPHSLPRHLTDRPPSQREVIDVETGYDAAFDTPVSKQTPKRRDISRDLGIPFLASGRAFANVTYIGKGVLFELIHVVFKDMTPLPPGEVICRGFQIGCATEVREYCTMLPKLCDSLFEAITGLPDGDPEQCYQEWARIMRCACQYLSFALSRCSEEEGGLLRGTVNETTAKLVQRIGDPSVLGEESDCLFFAICWFAVEMLTRAGNGGSPLAKVVAVPSSDCWNTSVSLLVRQLLGYGLQRSMEPLLSDAQALDDLKNTDQYTAELWVCLIHLLDHCRPPVNSQLPESHSLWHFIITAFQHDFPTLINLESSEMIWRCIFSLSALSQFSIHGMTTSHCNLPACWPLVGYALSKIRLKVDADLDRSLSDSSLTRRDEYIALVTFRCHHLVSQWHWSPVEAFGVLQQIAEMFRTRRYANLRHEFADFPALLRYNSLELLDKYDRSDTTYTLFLKLFVRAAQASRPGQHLSPRAKKLLSIIIPVTPVDFTKASPPTVQDLSMLHNRYASVAVAIFLEPSDIRIRIGQARSYVSLDVADDHTRMACIRGMNLLGQFIVQQRWPLTDLVSWLEMSALAFASEYDNCNIGLIQRHQSGSSNDRSMEGTKSRVVLCVQMLLGSIRHILETYRDDTNKRYPDPMLLNCCSPIFRNARLNSSDSTALEIRRLVETFLEIRRGIIPPPPRPPLRSFNATNESQDEYADFNFDDLDMNDPALLAALGDEGTTVASQDQKAEESLACETVHTQIYPVIYRHFSKLLRSVNGSNFSKLSERINQWIDGWLGCAALVVQNGKMPWSTYLKVREDTWSRIDFLPARRWIDLRVMLTLLRLDPTCYALDTDRFLTVLMESLAAVKVTVENEYASLMFSIDGLRHEVLQGILLERADGNEDFDIPRPKFAEVRASILEAIVAVIDRRLAQEAEGNAQLGPDNQRYVGLLLAMFLAMDGELKALDEGSRERQAYVLWCQQAYTIVQRHKQVQAEERLRHWINWGRNLAPS